MGGARGSEIDLWVRVRLSFSNCSQGARRSHTIRRTREIGQSGAVRSYEWFFKYIGVDTITLFS